MDAYDFMFKFLLIGDSNVGKSCLLYRLLENKFHPECPHTVGVEFGTRQMRVSERVIKLQIWDTAGQERFRSITRSYYRGACGALLVYDIARRETYNGVQQWMDDVRMLAGPDVVLVLVGNKADLDDDREVTFLEASKLAQENGCSFMETSAKTGENVEEAFVLAMRSILARIDAGQLNLNRASGGIQVGDRRDSTQQPRRKCC